MAASAKLESTVPPLESGDRMASEEFHRRYQMHPEIRKAELVEGVVYVASPVRVEHAERHTDIARWLAAYLGSRQDIAVFDNVTVKLDTDNECQPDVCMFHRSSTAATIGHDGFVHGSPELVVEISVSSVSYDLHAKKNAYRRNGVQEYIVWRVFDRAIDWFVLREGEYQPLAADADGILHSEVFPGLRLAAQKMLDGDLAGVLTAQTG